MDKDEDIEIKRGYAISLKTIGTPEAFNALIEIFKQPGAMRPNCSCEHDKKPVVPVMTSPFAIFVKDEMLSTTANDSIVFLNNNLESILKIAGNNKENIQIRYLMLDIIDEMKNEKAVPFILESFRFDFKFRIMGIFAISHIGDKTIPYLIDFIKSEKSNAFTGSLGELFSKLKNYSSPITNLYVDGTPEIKEKVLKILLTAGNMDLLAQITVKANSDERLFIAKVINKQNADSYFINILQIKDSELSLIACDNLAQLKSERAINLCLLGLLNSEDKKLQAAAQNAIKAIASKFNADDYINTYLNENQQEVIQNLFVEILTEFGSDITPTLIKYIDHKDKVLKKKVLTVFLKIGADTAPELIKLISDKNKRAAAIDILKQMDQKIIPSLIQSLNSPDPMVIFAIKEIIVLRQADSNQYLIQNLNNENLPIQLACAELLAAQNLKNAIPTLIIFLSAENKAYQLRAVFALVKYQEAALDPLSIEWEKQNKDKGFFESILQIFKKDKSILKDKKLKLFNQNVNKVFYTIGAKALDNLIVMAKTYKDNELKIEIFKYLKTIKNEKISLLFIENLENIDPDIVIASCEGLAALKEEKGEQALKNIISKTKNEKIKQSAEFALRQINGSKK